MLDVYIHIYIECPALKRMVHSFHPEGLIAYFKDGKRGSKKLSNLP